MAEAWPTAAKVLEYQHGQMPMFFETLWVKVKLKFSVPRAGREMPSIFCSTQGPTSVSVVVPALIVCHGQASLIWGSRTLIPNRCRAAESAASTAQAITLRNTRPTSTRTAAHVSLRGICRRGLVRTLARARGTGARPASRYGCRSDGGGGCDGTNHVSPSSGPSTCESVRSARPCDSPGHKGTVLVPPGRRVVSMPTRKIRKRTIWSTFYPLVRES